jgi:hypothetical protein
MVMRYNTFPNFSQWNRLGKNPLVAPGFTRTNSEGVDEIYSGSLNYLEFVQVVKKIWEELHPEILIIPYNPNRDVSTSFDETVTAISSSNVAGLTPSEYPPITIGYSLELRKPHTMDPKPRMRHQLNNSINVWSEISKYSQFYSNGRSGYLFWLR